MTANTSQVGVALIYVLPSETKADPILHVSIGFFDVPWADRIPFIQINQH